MNGAPSVSHVRAQVEAVLHKNPGARVIGIRAPEVPWAAPTLRVCGQDLPVLRGGSVLEVRAQLADLPADGPPCVLLTALHARELGDDLVARLASAQLYSIEPWQLVKDQFRARYVDPRLVQRHAWTASELIDAAPEGGYPPVPGGFLEAETAWRHLFERLLGLPAGERDPETLLTWALEGEPVARWAALSEDVQKGMARAVEESAGSAARHILECAARMGLRAVSVGLVARVLFDPEVQSQGHAAKAQGKLEALLGLSELEPALAHVWGDAAHAMLLRAMARPEVQSRTLSTARADADALLRELGAEELAWRSELLESGLHQRVSALARELTRFVEGEEREVPGSLRTAAERALRHRLLRADPRRCESVEMALRLAGWLGNRRAQRTGKPASLREAALDYRAEGGFADWARTRVWSGDTSSQALSTAYACLAQEADRIRELQNRQFAALLRGWLTSGSHEPALFGVEAVLDRVLVPLAKAHPVLLLVIDAMNVAVFRELERDLVQREWIELVPREGALRPAVVAALPSVTEVSRASLLCGQIASGLWDRERDGFTSHPGLVGAGEPMHPPLLFHKGKLREASTAGVAPEVREAIVDLHHRVVGVVINAVDDHLAKGDQIRVDWTVHSIVPLAELIELARHRTLVLVSDHGHVLERATEMHSGEGGERWRRPGDDTQDWELLMEGPRVVAPGGRLCAPWSERVRFGMKKNGYHGGATPQEVVIPLAVFATPETAARLTDWAEAPPQVPAWWAWRETEEPPRRVQSPSRPKPKVPRSRPRSAPDQQSLFEAPAPQESTWVDLLLESDLLASRRQRASRTHLTDERIRTMLHALDERGGKLTSVALADRLGVAPFRLAGFVSALRRILNIDGYDVLSLDETSDTIELNRDLLETQFGLERR